MFFSSLLDIIFPSLCLSCCAYTSDRRPVCQKCLAKIKISETLFCGKCGNRLPENKNFCHPDFPYLLGAAGDYRDEILRNLIHALKFRYLRPASEPLAELLIAYAEKLSLPLEEFIVIPLPLSAARLRRRGFNQSELLAEIFAKRFRLKLGTNILIRPKNTKPQSEIKDFNRRAKNIGGAFFVSQPQLLKGKKIILIDDVSTSGATFLEAAKILKSAGAKKIIALAAAKA